MIPLLLSLLPLLLDITTAKAIKSTNKLIEESFSTTSPIATFSRKHYLTEANVPVVSSIQTTPGKKNSSHIFKIDSSNLKIHNHSNTYQETEKNNYTNLAVSVKSIKEIIDTNISRDNLNEVSLKEIENTHSREIRSDSGDNFGNYDSLRTMHKDSTTIFDLQFLSQMYNFNLNETLSVIEQSKTKLETESYVLSKNETLKSLGSVDVMVPSLRGMELIPRGDQNHSRLSEGSKMMGRNRSSSQMLGRTDAPMLNYIFDTYSTLNKHHHRNDRFGGPRFESPGTTVTVDTEADANLDCRVSSLQDKLVSWVRRRPGHDKLEILTIGQQTYTADPRFSVDYLVPSTWRLILRGAAPSDSGTYECQLSTHPPLISRHQLIVNAPVVEIVEAAVDKYYERNSTLELGCRVRHLPTTAVHWLHQARVLNDDTQRGGISVRIEAVPGGADSILQVARLTAKDGGRYTCSVKAGLQASVNVHVLNGESLAELQQTAGASTLGAFLPMNIAAVILINLTLFPSIGVTHYIFVVLKCMCRRIYVR